MAGEIAEWGDSISAFTQTKTILMQVGRDKTAQAFETKINNSLR